MAAAEMLNRAEVERRQQQLLAYETDMLVQQAADRERAAILAAEAEAARAAHARLAAAASASAGAAAVPHHHPAAAVAVAAAPHSHPPAAAAAAAAVAPTAPVPAPVAQPGVAPVAPTAAAAAPIVQASAPAASAPSAAAPTATEAVSAPTQAAPPVSTAEATVAAALEAKKANAVASAPAKAKAKSKGKSTAAAAGGGGGAAKGKGGTTPKKGAAAAATKRKTPAGGGGTGPALKGPIPSLDDPVPPITSQDYDNLEALMNQFCRVPLLAEFSRPVSSLHPELVPVYSKVVKHPVDLSKVCRSIRRRAYKDTRAVRLDIWRIFANCIKFHCHPSTREGAIPSFVSIALHLRDYFNALWEEYMLPSESPGSATKSAKAKANPTQAAYHQSFKTRDERRKKRIVATSTTALSNRTLERVATEIENFTDANGMVDGLDGEPIVSPMTGMESADEVAIKKAYDAVVVGLTKLKEKMTELANENEEYTVAELQTDLKNCYSTEVFADHAELRKKLGDRLNRLMGKIVVPIFETNCRGVNQSSVWGCMAACIWARESSKKPYWPALVLGIMAPEDQREDWHNALTERNEGRLPESLRQQLEAGKRKAVTALKRQSTGKAERMSFFLVEFLGTHEFTWCKESDIIEQFDPEEDPDTHVGGPQGLKKKKHHTRDHRINPQTERLRQKAVEEGRWALEEFEMQLSDTCGDLYLSDDEDNDDHYSYDVLCQSEAEGDSAVKDAGAASADGAPSWAAASPSADDDTLDGTISDEEEIAELLSTEGMLDYSVAGRKLAKKRVAAIKKVKTEKAKALQKKKKAEQEKKKKADAAKKKKADATKGKAENKKIEREMQKQQKELEKRRKKRERDREMMEKKAKKAKISALETVKKGGRTPGGIPDKKERATAVVRGYLTRIAKKEDLAGLGFSSAATLPSSAVESTSLLGMALAFRAAAGYAEMPVGKGEEPVKKPWDKIDTEGPSKSEDRCKNLAQQAEMLEQELAKIEKENGQRRVLIAQAHRQREAREKKAIRKEERIKKQSAPKKKTAKKPKESESGKTTPVLTKAEAAPKAEPMPSAVDDSRAKENDPVPAPPAAAAAAAEPVSTGADTGVSEDVVMAEAIVEPAPAPAPVPSQQ